MGFGGHFRAAGNAVVVAEAYYIDIYFVIGLVFQQVDSILLLVRILALQDDSVCHDFEVVESLGAGGVFYTVFRPRPALRGE